MKPKYYHIQLFCAHGFSSLLLCKVIQDQICDMKLSYSLEASPYSTLLEKGEQADIILLGPQIAYLYQDAKALFPRKPILIIDMSIYSSMDASELLYQIQDILTRT